MLKLFRENSNLCDHNPPTSQTDRQTDFPTAPLFDAPLGKGGALEFLDETYSTKIRGMGLPYGENFMILSFTVFVRYTLLRR